MRQVVALWPAVAAALVIASWFLGARISGYSRKWSLIIEGGGSLLPLLIVLWLYHKQTRETRAINADLDEMNRSIERVRVDRTNLDNFSAEKRERLRREFQRTRERQRSGQNGNGNEQVAQKPHNGSDVTSDEK